MRRSGRVGLRAGRLAALGLLAIAGSLLHAHAQSTGTGEAGSTGSATGGASPGIAAGALGGSTAVDTSQGGVGGTGLGKMPAGQGKALGQGQSVSGPAGQGIKPNSPDIQPVK